MNDNQTARSANRVLALIATAQVVHSISADSLFNFSIGLPPPVHQNENGGRDVLFTSPEPPSLTPKSREEAKVYKAITCYTATASFDIQNGRIIIPFAYASET